MSKSTNGLRKAGLASLAVTLTLGAGIAGAGVANADADFEFTRIAGDNRYETAALVADTYATATTDEVILVNGEAGYYADALTANYLSGMRKAPILLTRDEFMPEATKTALADLDPAKVTIVGGEGVVPADQADWLESEGYTVERFAGANRFETNVEVIEAGGATTKDTGIVATGFDFADALGAGPAVYQGRPLGLSKSDDIDDAIVDALDASGVTKIVVLGGEAVVGQEVVDELEDAGFTVTRVDGADRSETSTEFADYAIANFGFTNTAADVASGYTLGSGADALAGGPLTGERNRPMLITKNLDNPGDLLNWLEAHAATLSEGVIYGGYGAVTASAEDRMEAAARSVSSNQDYTVGDGTAATNTVSNDDGTNDNRGARTYSVSGLDDDETYKLGLVPAEDVTVDDNGVVTFDDDADTVADNNYSDFNTAAVIERVNNTAAPAPVVNDLYAVQSVSGNLTFRVDSYDPESVVPVLFVDGPDVNAIDLNADDEPTEAFGIGGQKTWIEAEAGQGTGEGPVEVVSVDKAQDYFTTGAALYEYDANDDYAIGANQATFEEFEAALSSGDQVTVADYQPNDALESSFTLVDENPGTPTGVTAEQVGEDVKVSWTPSGDDVDTFNIYRALSKNGTDCTGLVAADYSIVGTDTASPFTDTSVALNEQYCYTVSEVNDGQEGDRATTADFIATQSADTVAPTSVDAFVDNDILVGDTAGAGDTWKVVFSEVMDTTTTNDVIRVRDADGSVADVVCDGTNVTCTFNGSAEDVNGTEYAAGRVLTVTFTVTGATTEVTQGTEAGIQYPATVVDSSGITDERGNGWDEAASADKVIDEE